MFFKAKAAGMFYKDELIIPYTKFEALGGTRPQEPNPVTNPVNVVETNSS